MKNREETRQLSSGNWSLQLEQKQVPKRDGTRCPEGSAFPAGMPQPLQCSMETTGHPVKDELGIKVKKLVKSPIGWEATGTGRVSECHLTFARGILHTFILPNMIIVNKIPVSTIKLPP